MSLIHVKILGIPIDDALVFKLFLGTICTTILIFLVGTNALYDWALKSIVIWSGVTMIIIPLTYGFIEESFTIKHIIMMITGFVITILFCIFSKFSAEGIVISIVQSLIWMTIFSLILDGFKEKLQ